MMLCTLIAIVTSGCINVPSNTVSFKSPGGYLKLSHPQNTDMTNIVISIATNGTVTASIGYLHTVNNPDVINSTAAGEIGKINALGKIIADGVAAGVSAAK